MHREVQQVFVNSRGEVLHVGLAPGSAVPRKLEAATRRHEKHEGQVPPDRARDFLFDCVLRCSKSKSLRLGLAPPMLTVGLEQLA